jgi:hypothetical protein
MHELPLPILQLIKFVSSGTVLSLGRRDATMWRPWTPYQGVPTYANEESSSLADS